MSVQKIKVAVQQLNLQERAEVAACLHSWSDDERSFEGIPVPVEERE